MFAKNPIKLGKGGVGNAPGKVNASVRAQTKALLCFTEGQMIMFSDQIELFLPGLTRPTSEVPEMSLALSLRPR